MQCRTPFGAVEAAETDRGALRRAYLLDCHTDTKNSTVKDARVLDGMRCEV
jgi:hypothetical protein